MKAFSICLIAHFIILLSFLSALPLTNMPEHFHNGQYPSILEYEECFFLFKIGIILYAISAPFVIYKEIFPKDSLLCAILSFIFVSYHPFEYLLDNQKKEIKIRNPFNRKFFISQEYFPDTIKAITKDGRKLFLKWDMSNVEYLTYNSQDGTGFSPQYHKKNIFNFKNLNPHYHREEKIDIDNIKSWKPYAFGNSESKQIMWNWLFYKVYPLKAGRGT